jgi:tetratricopeptide (TPR) repeat protein
VRSAKCEVRNNKRTQHTWIAVILTTALAAFLPINAARAEIKVIEADSTYVLGDNDSKVDGRRIATQEAQRKALNLAGTYVSSLTQVKEYRLTKDEVIAYTAGIVETHIIADETRGTLDHPELYIRARCSVDTDILLRQIDRYRESEELREQLETAAKEKEALRKERDALLKQLSSEQDKAKAGETRKKLDTVLSGEESIDDTTRAWVKLSPQIDFYGGRESRREIKPADLDAAEAGLRRTVERAPGNVRARILLASVYQQQHDYAAAEKELRTTLERAPKNALVHLQLGVVLREQGKYAEAFKEFRFIEHKRPNHPQMLFQTALTHKASGNCRLAVGYMKRFLLYTKKNGRPEIAKLKPKANKIIEECGVQPVPRKKQR